MSRRKWQLSQFDKTLAARIAYEHSLDEFAVFMLISRGITDENEIASFLSSDGEFSDPFDIKDMDKAVKAVDSAIENGDKITIYGDYDADGVTATALLFSFLQMTGADVDYYIPSRVDEGYGLNRDAVDKLKKRGTKLIITVDNGISAVEETEYIKSLGMNIVITDHHQPGSVLPGALAVVDPHRSDDTCSCRDLAGVGVAFMLAAALEGGDVRSIFDDFADLAVIGTIADIVPLRGENRLLVSRGLNVINNSERPGILALRRRCGFADKDLTASSVAFSLSPRINASGRVSSAENALKLLITEDEGEAERLACILDECNAERQGIESDIIDSAVLVVESDSSYAADRVLVVSGRGWHAGVIGIVASRLVDKYGKPAIVIAEGESGGIAKGSCRSVEGFSLFEALTNVKSLLVKFGGHKLAAGFSVENEKIEEFRRAINDYADTLPEFNPVLKLDCKLNPAGINEGLLNSLSLLEPFGAENPQPVFCIGNLTVSSVKGMGDGRHVSLILERANTSFRAVWFGVSEAEFPFFPGESIDIAANIEKNEYKGKIRPSVMIRAAKLSGIDDDELFRGFSVYKKAKYSAVVSDKIKETACPDRRTAADVFRFVKKGIARAGGEEEITARLGLPPFAVCRVHIALDALIQTGVIKIENGYYVTAELSSKVSLSSAEILKKLGYTEQKG